MTVDDIKIGQCRWPSTDRQTVRRIEGVRQRRHRILVWPRLVAAVGVDDRDLVAAGLQPLPPALDGVGDAIDPREVAIRKKTDMHSALSDNYHHSILICRHPAVSPLIDRDRRPECRRLTTGGSCGVVDPGQHRIDKRGRAVVVVGCNIALDMLFDAIDHAIDGRRHRDPGELFCFGTLGKRALERQKRIDHTRRAGDNRIGDR